MTLSLSTAVCFVTSSQHLCQVQLEIPLLTSAFHSITSCHALDQIRSPVLAVIVLADASLPLNHINELAAFAFQRQGRLHIGSTMSQKLQSHCLMEENEPD
jgi:hypothetical protein